MNNGINSTNQLPNQQTNPLPTQLPSNSVTGNSNAGTWLNGTVYTGNNSSAAPSSLTSAMAVAAWVQNVRKVSCNRFDRIFNSLSSNE